MLSISHAATGAFIATHIPNPNISVPLILASHYALDAVAHYDAGTGLSSGKKTRPTALILGLVDLTLAGIIVFAMYPTVPILAIASDRNFAPYLGAFVGLLPDFIEAPRNFLKYEPVWLSPLNRFHHSFHHSIPDVAAGLAPQILLLLCLWFLR